MSLLRSENASVNYQPISTVRRKPLNSFTNDTTSGRKLKTATTFEVKITKAFKIKSFHRFVWYYYRYYYFQTLICDNSSLFTSVDQENPKNQSLDDSTNYILPSKYENEGQDQKFLKRKFSGWRGGIILNAVIASFVLLLNIVFLAWAVISTGYKIEDGLITVFDGNCAKARNLSLVSHLIINILSTLLLAASNYAMQVVSSPSRSDIDRAHQKQIWLDIGVFSLRNFGWISRYRFLAYILLVLSSVPLHFM